MIHTHQTARTQFLEANDIRFAYRRFGKPNGVPLVFNQHYTGTMDLWDPAKRTIMPLRGASERLKGRAIAGPYDYDQIPALVKRSKLRVKNFYADLDANLSARPFAAGDHFSAADITALVTVDFATKAMSFPVPDEHKALRRWFEKVSSRPSAGA